MRLATTGWKRGNNYSNKYASECPEFNVPVMLYVSYILSTLARSGLDCIAEDGALDRQLVLVEKAAKLRTRLLTAKRSSLV